MTTNELVQEIRSYCLENADDERALKSQHYFKEEFNGYGVAAPLIYTKVKELFLEKWKNSAPRLIFQYACEKMTSENKSRFIGQNNLAKSEHLYSVHIYRNGRLF